MANDKEHIQLLDFFRGIAILSVFLFHCVGDAFGHDHFPWKHGLPDFSSSTLFLAFFPLTFGWAGVAIFFVVSGFCIHLSFAKDPVNSWTNFFTRRFFRIYPPYLLALVYFAFAFPTTRLLFDTQSDTHSSLTQLGSHVLLFQNFYNKCFFGINSSFWSIAVEFQLYLLYPILLIMVRRIGWRRSLIAICLLEVLIRGTTGIVDTFTNKPLPVWFSGSPFCYWFSWAIGAALADAFIKKQPLPFCSLSLVALCLLAVGTDSIRPLHSFSFLFFALLTATVIARLLTNKRSMNNQAFNTHLRDLGICSYSFYLLHQPLSSLPTIFEDLVVPKHPLGVFLLCLCTYPFIYLLSRVYYQHIELRSIAIGKHIVRRISPLQPKPTMS